MMDLLVDAVSWSGSEVTLILFTAWRPGNGPSTPLSGHGTLPETVRTYALQDADDPIGDVDVYEYDLVFEQVPPDLATVVTSWLRAALDAGATGAWFAFEGSFSFEHLLTADIANQVFGTADATGVRLALEDSYRGGGDWQTDVVMTGERLLLGA